MTVALREEHRHIKLDSWPGFEFCSACVRADGTPIEWPCDTARLQREVLRLESELETSRALNASLYTDMLKERDNTFLRLNELEADAMIARTTLTDIAFRYLLSDEALPRIRAWATNALQLMSKKA